MAAIDLNLRHLKAAVATAESGSLSSAAFQVNLTQPAITQGIAKLERLLGLPLFERRPGGMEPTEAARILVPRAEAVYTKWFRVHPGSKVRYNELRQHLPEYEKESQQ